MDIETLKPVHGWRGFAGEVGVIVLGVLLALGAQQVVENLQQTADVDAFRKTVDNEVAMNLFVLEFGARQMPCARARITEVRQWLEKTRSSGTGPPIYARSPIFFDPYLSAWSNRDAETFRRLPADVRQHYAMFYDLVTSQKDISDSQGDAWRSIGAYREPGPVGVAERRGLWPQIGRIRGSSEAYESNFQAARSIANGLGIKAAVPEDIKPVLSELDLRCRSIHEAPPPPKPETAPVAVPAKG